MAFLSEEINRFKTLSDEMVKLVENKDTSSEAAVVCGRIGKVCTNAIARDAAQAAKRQARADNVTKFQTARQKRMEAKKGGTPSASTQAGPSSTARQRAAQ